GRMIRIILCRPAGPRNVGMILRVCQNFGPCELWLVDPTRPSLLVHPEFVQMSHGVEEAKEQVQTVGTLTEALADVTLVVGFTARVRGKRKREDWRALQPEIQEHLEAGRHRVALVFGAEEMGMTREEVDLCHRLAHVRTSEQHTSLNLAMSVGVILSSLFTGKGVRVSEPGARMLSGEGREFLKKRMIEVFAGRVAQSDEAARLITASIERVFSRAELEDRDGRAWHLMLRALGSDMRPDDVGLTPHTKGARRERLIQRHLDGEDKEDES
ncbi:MAG: RNA methyltransferase, partial [Planctomycetes bacterium]|nr:RNA methyltransferase [Planctomycetota bacterium]